MISARNAGGGLREVLLEVLQALHRMLQRVGVLAEGEPGVCLADGCVLLAVELGQTYGKGGDKRVWWKQYLANGDRGHANLHRDKPACATYTRLKFERRHVRMEKWPDSPEVAPSPKDALREWIIVRPLDVTNVLHEALNFSPPNPHEAGPTRRWGTI